MTPVNIIRNYLASICLLLACLYINPLFATGQVPDKKAANPERMETKGQAREESKQGKVPGEEKELNEADEQMAIRLNQQKLQSIVEQVIAGLEHVEPVETRILAYVETAASLWKHDKPRSYQLIQRGVELLDKVYEKKADSGMTLNLKTIKEENEAKEQLLKVVIRKIALLDASLAEQLERDRREKREEVKIEYTETSQSVMDSAVALAQDDPIRASQIARDSLSRSQGVPRNTITILFALHSKDKAVAEKLAVDFIKHFESVPYSLANLGMIAQYVFFQEGSTERLRDLYSHAFANRLYNDLLLAPRAEYLPRLRSSLMMSLRFAANFPKSRQQFEQLRVEVENYLPAGQPGSPQVTIVTKAIDMSDLLPAKEGDTQAIKEAQARAAMLIDPNQRDKEYSRLAASAAQKADQSLAEELLDKIKDDQIRNAASVSVYGPLIRKAQVEKDWNRAQYLTAKVADPLGRSFVLIDVASGMGAAKIEKDAIFRFYAGGLSQLQTDPDGLIVGKAYLALVTPLLPLDLALATTAAQGAVRSFNNSKLPRPYSTDAALAQGAATWGQGARAELGATQDMFELTAVLPKIFQALAAKSPIESQTLADQIFDRGLQTFAQLGIINAKFAEQSKQQPRRKPEGADPALPKQKDQHP